MDADVTAERPGDAADGRYLIVGGATKAGTTSVFAYLSDHPHVCPASLKEPRFFLEPDHPVKGGRGARGGLDAYREFFEHCGDDGRLRVEATPNYLYSADAPVLIRKCLPSVRVAFVLRHPVGRLASWYRFALQNGMLERSVPFAEYVRDQLEGAGGDAPPQHLRALEQGRYAGYVERYLDVLGPERVRVLFFEELVSDPRAFMGELCEFAGLPPAFYDDYEFRVHNPTRSIRFQAVHRAYKRVEYRIRRAVHRRPRLHRLLRRARRAVDAVYLALNEGEEDTDPELPPGLEEELAEYYRPGVSRLEGMLGEAPPWPDLLP